MLILKLSASTEDTKNDGFVNLSKIVVTLGILLVSLLLSEHTTATQINPNSMLTGQWVNSDQLRPGMIILTSDNRKLTVLNSWKQSSSQTTYNLAVANSHTYFVSEQALWAHNTTECDKNLWQRFVNRIRGKKSVPTPDRVEITTHAEKERLKLWGPMHKASDPLLDLRKGGGGVIDQLKIYRLKNGKIEFSLDVKANYPHVNTKHFNGLRDALDTVAGKYNITTVLQLDIKGQRTTEVFSSSMEALKQLPP